MKTVAELNERKIQALKAMNAYREKNGFRVVVGMATCGRAAGAEPVMQAIVDEVKKRNLQNVVVQETGCIGVCRFEPMVEVYDPSGKKVTYVKMDAEKAHRVVAEHLVNRKPVVDFTIGAFNG
jgi:NADP-reducing hydrogenase subunit HndB